MHAQFLPRSRPPGFALYEHRLSLIDNPPFRPMRCLLTWLPAAFPRRTLSSHPSQSPKATNLRKIVSDGFRANKDVADPAKLHVLKQAAERGLSNYLLFERAKQDPKIAAAAAKQDVFEDDEEGNLVVAGRSRSGSAAPAVGKGKRAGSAEAIAAAGAATGSIPLVTIPKKRGRPAKAAATEEAAASAPAAAGAAEKESQ